MWRNSLLYAGTALIAVTYGLALYAYGLFVPRIREAFQLDTAQLGLIASGAYTAYTIATLLSGTVSTWLGPRVPALIGGLGATIGMVMVGMSRSPGMLALGVFIMGSSPGWSYPPLSDAVLRLIPPAMQGRMLTWINAGTAFGVLLAGPIALWAGTMWRTAWLFFAALALAVTLWNGMVLPAGRQADAAAPAPRFDTRRLFTTASLPLFTVALLLGLAASTYWTFAVDLLVTTGGLAPSVGSLFWVIVGSAGLAGGTGGVLARRLGLAVMLRITLVGLAIALGSLPLATGAWSLIFLSATCFGSAFMFVTGLLGIWSIRIFHERPAVGFGVMLAAISIGQLIGPYMLGRFAGRFGLPMAFYVAAGLIGMAALVEPAQQEVPTESATVAVGESE